MKLVLRLRSGQVVKQTAAVSLEILGLNDDFVQMNELMTISLTFILNYVTQLWGKDLLTS
jgi:hypothetical protein